LSLLLATSPQLLPKLDGCKIFVLLQLLVVRFKFKTLGFLLLQSKLLHSKCFISYSS